MIIVPWRTDAPIYHFPYGTIGLIVVNIAVHFLFAMGDEGRIEPFILAFGAGLHPTQWITANFLHLGLFHLLGNMVFLWGFGIVVEGKIGWWRFLLLYLGIGTAENLIVQTLAQGLEGGALGASGAIFGIMAVAIVWAPKNEIHFFYFVWLISIFTGFKEVSIVAFACWYLVIELLFSFISGHWMSSSFLHLVGAALGFAMGVAMLKLHWVDCENWDLLAVMANRHGAPAKPSLRVSVRRPSGFTDVEEPEEDSAGSTSLARLRAALADGDFRKAHEVYSRLRRPEKISRRELRQLIAGLQLAGELRDSIPLMADYLKQFPDNPPRMRLKAAEVLIRHENRPRQALRLLEKVDAATLPEPLVAPFTRLKRQAERLSADGVIEVETQDW